jgi:hypothetical protein
VDGFEVYLGRVLPVIPVTLVAVPSVPNVPRLKNFLFSPLPPYPRTTFGIFFNPLTKPPTNDHEPVSISSGLEELVFPNLPLPNPSVRYPISTPSAFGSIFIYSRVDRFARERGGVWVLEEVEGVEYTHDRVLAVTLPWL